MTECPSCKANLTHLERHVTEEMIRIERIDEYGDITTEDTGRGEIYEDPWECPECGVVIVGEPDEFLGEDDDDEDIT